MSKRPLDELGPYLPTNDNKKGSGALSKVNEKLGDLWHELATYPGYKYLGKQAGMNHGRPVNDLDYIAYQHDVYYIRLEQEHGVDPTAYWSAADHSFMVALLNLMRYDPDKWKYAPEVRIAYSFFKLKWLALGRTNVIAFTDADVQHINYIMPNDFMQDSPVAQNPSEILMIAPPPEDGATGAPTTAPPDNQMDVDFKKVRLPLMNVPAFLKTKTGWRALYTTHTM